MIGYPQQISESPVVLELTDTREGTITVSLHNATSKTTPQSMEVPFIHLYFPKDIESIQLPQNWVKDPKDSRHIYIFRIGEQPLPTLNQGDTHIYRDIVIRFPEKGLYKSKYIISGKNIRRIEGEFMIQVK